MSTKRHKLLVLANTSWHLFNFRLPLIKAVQQRDVEVVAVAPFDEFTPMLENCGIRCEDLQMGRRTLNPVRDVSLLIRLERIFRRERPHIVFHNTIKPVIYGSLAADWAGVPTIVNMIPGLGYVFSGNQLPQRMLRPLVERMYRLAMRRTDSVLFQNPDDKEFFCSAGLVEEQKTRVIYGSGVDLEAFAFAEPREGDIDCTFLMMGRMLWDKGVGEFVAAAKKVKAKHPRSRFALLGIIDKDNPSYIPEETITGWDQAGVIEYRGSATDVRSVLEKADVVVLPSYYREGVPKSLLEAAAMGKPVITTDMPGCREAVRDKVTGLLISPKNVDDLVAAMSFMIENPSERVIMGRKGRDFIAERFDVNRVNGEIIEAMGL